MGTAIFTGVTGLLAHQRRMDVVANNIANLNTTGYRGSSAQFQDLLSQTLEGGSPPAGTTGGTNPTQIGLGVTLGSVSVNFGQGPLASTGVNTDLAIQGTGFFILSDGSHMFYTRDGSFSRDANGALVDPSSGYHVRGYSADSNGVVDSNKPVDDIIIPIGTASIVQTTANAIMSGNLDANAEVGTEVDRTIRVYDSLGTARDVRITFTKTNQVTDGGTAYNAWLWKATFDGTNDVTNVNSGETGVLLFDANGVYHDEGSIDAGVTDTFKSRSTLASSNEVLIPAALLSGGSVPVTPFEFSVDFSQMTELSSTSDVTLTSQDGYPRGVLEDFNVGADGFINGVFTNGLTRVIGQVALATFSNVGGLSRSGGNTFVETPSSGVAQIGAPGTGGRGSISGGVLEGSNVDLGTEFSNMIITQRGYQANARTITAADTLLQEAVNLIR